MYCGHGFGYMEVGWVRPCFALLMGSSGWNVTDSLVVGHSPEVVALDQREGMLSILKATNRLVLRMVGQPHACQQLWVRFPVSLAVVELMLLLSF